MYDRSAIFRAAWAEKKLRSLSPQPFGTYLRMAWFDAKLAKAARAKQAAAAAHEAHADVAFAYLKGGASDEAVTAARTADLRAELEAMQYGDFIPWDRHRALSAELAGLGA